jgi:SAM-dependent methyltransferase
MTYKLSRVTADQQGWQLAERVAAEVYQRRLVPAMTAMWARALVGRAGAASGERVLDVACGTGALTRTVLEARADASCVVGVDNNAAMLAVAREVPTPSGVQVAWLRASAQALPVRAAAFDVVFCEHGLPFIADRGAALVEMRRALRPGGRVAVCVFGPIEHNPGTNALADALDSVLGGGTARVKRIEHALADIAGLHSLISTAGFHDLSIGTETRLVHFPSVADYVQVQLTGTPLSRVIPAAEEPARDHLIDALIDNVTHELSRYIRDGALTFPQQVHAVLAYRYEPGVAASSAQSV